MTSDQQRIIELKGEIISLRLLRVAELGRIAKLEAVCRDLVSTISALNKMDINGCIACHNPNHPLYERNCIAANALKAAKEVLG